MGTNSTWGMDVFVRLFCVCAVLCTDSDLATGWSPAQGFLPTVKNQDTEEVAKAQQWRAVQTWTDGWMDRSFFQRIRPSLRLSVIFCNKFILYGMEFLAPRPIPKLEDHFLSAFLGCLSNTFATTVQVWRLSALPTTCGRAMPWWQGAHLTWA
jgi:hypothetical protein